MDDRKKIADQWHFRWPIMDVLIGGESAIDTPSTFIRNMEEATRFLIAYGYNPDHPQDARLMHAVIVESLTFIERELMPREWKKGLRPPVEILQCDDPRWLLVWAAEYDEPNKFRRAWACALLRVMHSIAHIEGSYRYVNVDAAKSQIRQRFEEFLERDQFGQVTAFTDGSMRVPLVRFDWKGAKSRRSILLKLLHKRANVAETIYDLVGVRFVTRTQPETVLLLKMLVELGIVSYPNCVPSRARNALVDTDEFRKRIDELRGQLLSEKVDIATFESKIADLILPHPDRESEASQTSNPHTAANYRSLQLTGRQLIRGINPAFSWLAKMTQAAESLSDRTAKAGVKELIAALQGWHGMDRELDMFAFFPFEVQIMDETAYTQNSQGAASHTRYKNSQLRAARRRVLGEVLQK